MNCLCWVRLGDLYYFSCDETRPELVTSGAPSGFCPVQDMSARDIKARVSTVQNTSASRQHHICKSCFRLKNLAGSLCQNENLVFRRFSEVVWISCLPLSGKLLHVRMHSCLHLLLIPVLLTRQVIRLPT
jgi:hypothetical protein